MTRSRNGGVQRRARKRRRRIFVRMTNWGAGLTIWVGGATSWGIGTVRFRPYDTEKTGPLFRAITSRERHILTKYGSITLSI